MDSGWRDISTAPKDGTRVLFLMAEGHRHYGPDRVHIGWLNKFGDHCWQGLGINPPAVSWQPLPDPPPSDNGQEKCHDS
jgi:hypothetical protein